MENLNAFSSVPSGSPALPARASGGLRAPVHANVLPLKEEWLPFTIKLVQSQADLDKAVHIRHEAYARHLPDFAQSLLKAERADYEPGVVVLLAESKLDGSPLGKLEIYGPDAADFLDLMYVGTMSTLPVGGARYGLLLYENGVIVDDGIVARLAPQHFWVNTTSGGAARVALAFDEWLQCEYVNHRVLVTPVTADWGNVTVSGPRAWDLLRAAGCDAALAPAQILLYAFQSTRYPVPSLSTGKLLSNMQRLGLNVSMQCLNSGPQASASWVDEAGLSHLSKPSPR